jgi:tRNA dimethylallyltransferase
MIAAVLCGATAAGKSALALKLARANGFEIISADSRQIYRGFEVGTNAPTAADGDVPHHLVGFEDPARSFSPREYPSRVHALLAAHPDTRFLIVGGTGLYLKELLYPSPFDRGPTPEAIKNEVQNRIRDQGLPRMHAELLRLDPDGARALHPNDAYRIAKRWENLLLTGESYSLLTGPLQADPRFGDVPVFNIEIPREELYARIDKRVEQMLAAGWLEEVTRLMALPDWETLPAFSSLGYADFAAVVSGALSLREAVLRVQKLTRNYAKRQITFFRRQLPAAQTWDAHELERTLESRNWNWEAFLKRIPGQRERFPASQDSSETPSGTGPNP